MIAQIYFSVFATLALACALYLLVARHPLYGALSLIGTMLSLAGIYSLLSAPFLGVVQVLTYAGAIMMLVVFVIMVLNSSHDHVVPRFDSRGFILLLVPAVLSACLLYVLHTTHPLVDAGAIQGSAEAVSIQLFNTSQQGSGAWILFEFIGLLLLAAMVSAVVLAKKHLDKKDCV